MTNFLSLPGEIRNAIYDLTLFPHFPVVQIRASHAKDLLSTTLKSPLYRTSRVVQSEIFARLCKTKMLAFLDYKSFRVFMEYSGKLVDGIIAKHNLETISIKVIHIYEVDINATVADIKGFDMIEANKALADLESLKWARISATMQMHNLREYNPDYRPQILLERQKDGTLSPPPNPDPSISSPKKVIFGVLKHS